MLKATFFLPGCCMISTSTTRPAQQLREQLAQCFPHWKADSVSDHALLALLRVPGEVELGERVAPGVDLETLAPVKQIMFGACARVIWHILRRQVAAQYLPDSAPPGCRAGTNTRDVRQVLADFINDHDETHRYQIHIDNLMALTLPFTHPCSEPEAQAWEQAYEKAGLAPWPDDETQAPDKVLRYWTGVTIMLAAMTRDLILANCAQSLYNPMMSTKQQARECAREMAQRWQALSGSNIRGGKLLDIYARLLGFSQGYQQMKPYLSTEVTPAQAADYKRIKATSTRGSITRALDDIGQQGDNHMSVMPATMTQTQRNLRTLCDDLCPDTDFSLTQLDRRLTVLFMHHYLAQAWFDCMASRQVPQTPLNTMTRVALTLTALRQGSAHIPTARPCPDDDRLVATTASGLAESLKVHKDDISDVFYSTIDAFELAASLRDSGYRLINSNDVDTIECALAQHDSDYRRLEWLWADVTRPTPSYCPGEHIHFQAARGQESGTITDIYPHTPATYSIKMDGQAQDNTSRRLVRFEDALGTVTS